MFFFASVPLAAWGVALAVLIGLMVLNEVSRRNKLTGIIFFIIVPIILSIFVWPKTSGAESGAATANWFQWAKTYSAIAGCLIFMGLRFSEKIRAKKWYYILPMAILNLNIAEAVVREFQVAGMGNQVVNGMTYIGGPWNIMNAIAGILTALTVTGWFGIIISKSKTKDMIWPDMTWFWIVAYDLWNVAYLYNCVTDRAVYGGVVLLLSDYSSLHHQKGRMATAPCPYACYLDDDCHVLPELLHSRKICHCFFSQHNRLLSG